MPSNHGTRRNVDTGTTTERGGGVLTNDVSEDLDDGTGVTEDAAPGARAKVAGDIVVDDGTTLAAQDSTRRRGASARNREAVEHGIVSVDEHRAIDPSPIESRERRPQVGAQDDCLAQKFDALGIDPRADQDRIAVLCLRIIDGGLDRGVGIIDGAAPRRSSRDIHVHGPR